MEGALLVRFEGDCVFSPRIVNDTFHMSVTLAWEAQYLVNWTSDFCSNYG